MTRHDDRVDWGALAKSVVTRRVELGMHTQRVLAAAMGISSRIVGDIETARRQSYDRTTLARLERALRWPAGTVDAILHGAPAPDTVVLPPLSEDGITLEPLHPLARELHEMLRKDSPVPDEERQMLAELVDRVLERSRRHVARAHRRRA